MFGKQQHFFLFTEVLSRPIFILGDVFVFSTFRHDQTMTSWEHPTEFWPVKSMNGPNSIKNGLSWFISGLIENHYPINSENGEWHWSKRLRDIEVIGNRKSRRERGREWVREWRGEFWEMGWTRLLFSRQLIGFCITLGLLRDTRTKRFL